jgi:hypothetical protein
MFDSVEISIRRGRIWRPGAWRAFPQAFGPSTVSRYPPIFYSRGNILGQSATRAQTNCTRAAHADLAAMAIKTRGAFELCQST